MMDVGQISDFRLERYLLGELPEEEMRKLSEREAEDRVFAARVKAMREDNARILAENPFAALEAKLGDADASGFSPAGERRSGVNALWLKVAAALVIAVGVFFAVLLNHERPVADGFPERGLEVAMADVGDGTRVKGMAAGLEVWKKTGDSAVQMVNLGDAREGDEIQLRYRVPQKCFGMLLSMDGNGTVTMHMGEGRGAVELEPGKMTTLPFAYRLDDAPMFEKFFLLTSLNAFEIDVENFDGSLKQAGVESVSFTLRKVEK